MNFNRLKAVGKLGVLLGLPLATILAIFGGGVYCGVTHQNRIATFERDWLGVDVRLAPPPSGRASDRREGIAAESTVPVSDMPDPSVEDPRGSEPSPPRPRPDPGSAPDPNPSGPSGPDRSAPVSSSGPGAVDEPASGVPLGSMPDPFRRPVETEADAPVVSEPEATPTGSGWGAPPRVVGIKVLVDLELIEGRPDWIDYVQRTVSEASSTYAREFNVDFELVGVGRWSVATAGMSAPQLLDDLEGRPREGADILVGFTARPLDGEVSGRAQLPAPDDPFNGAYGVVYASPGSRQPHLRTLLHEVGHMFGALDITDPADPDYRAGSWMSYAPVADGTKPWIDRNNRARVLVRRDRPFHAPVGED